MYFQWGTKALIYSTQEVETLPLHHLRIRHTTSAEVGLSLLDLPYGQQLKEQNCVILPGLL